MKKKKLKTFRCNKCGKMQELNVPPYQRNNWKEDICKCDYKEDSSTS